MSNTSQVLSSWVPEATFGVTPASPTLRNARITGHSIKRVLELVRSAEIRSDRQNAELIAAGISVAGQINAEMSYGSHDVWLQNCLQSAGFSALVTNTGTIYSVTGAGAGFGTIARASGDWTADFGASCVGKWVKVTGFTNAGNAVRAKISAVTALNLGVTFAGSTMVNEAAGASVTVKLLEDITNGVTQGSISWEDSFTDVALFRQFLGISFNGFDITLQEGTKPVLISFDVVGKEETDSSATVGAGANTAVNTNPVIQSGSNVTQIYEANAAQTAFASASIAVRNNLRRRGVLGSSTAQSFGAGDFQCNGKFDTYFSTGTIHAKVLAATESALILQLMDSLGQGYILDMPATKYSEGDRGITGKAGDVMGRYVFDTKRHATEGITMRIVRFT